MESSKYVSVVNKNIKKRPISSNRKSLRPKGAFVFGTDFEAVRLVLKKLLLS